MVGSDPPWWRGDRIRFSFSDLIRSPELTTIKLADAALLQDRRLSLLAVG